MKKRKEEKERREKRKEKRRRAELEGGFGVGLLRGEGHLLKISCHTTVPGRQWVGVVIPMKCRERRHSLLGILHRNLAGNPPSLLPSALWGRGRSYNLSYTLAPSFPHHSPWLSSCCSQEDLPTRPTPPSPNPQGDSPTPAFPGEG